MQQFSQKYTVVQFFEAVPNGTEFMSSNWPLHATLVDTFAVDWTEEETIVQLTKLLSGMSEVQSVTKNDLYLGDNRVLVAVLEKTDGLDELHNKLVVLFDKGGLKLNDPQFSRRGFLPHSTVQSHARLYEGDEVLFNALSLVDMFPDKDPYKRRVVATIPLKR